MTNYRSPSNVPPSLARDSIISGKPSPITLKDVKAYQDKYRKQSGSLALFQKWLNGEIPFNELPVHDNLAHPYFNPDPKEEVDFSYYSSDSDSTDEETSDEDAADEIEFLEEWQSSPPKTFFGGQFKPVYPKPKNSV